MDRCADREIGVGNEFQPLESLRLQSLGAAGDHPPEFHLRKSDYLGQSAEREGQNIRIGGGEGHTRRIRRERIIRKNFIGNDREVVTTARLCSISPNSCRFRNDPVGLFGLTTTMARVRGVMRAWKRSRIEMPAMIVEQRVLDCSHRFQLREILEQRIGGTRYKYLVAGVGEQFEEIRVGFAGAGSEHDA